MLQVNFSTTSSYFTSLLQCRLPIEELFYHGKNPRTASRRSGAPSTLSEVEQNSREEEEYTVEEEDVWYDYYDDISPTATSAPSTSNTNSTPAPRTDYLHSLPDGIYCDLVMLTTPSVLKFRRLIFEWGR